MSLSPQHKLDAQNELFGRLCNEDIDADGFEGLQALLAGDLEAQRQYVRFLDLQVAMRLNAQSIDDEDFALLEAQAALDATPMIANTEALSRTDSLLESRSSENSPAPAVSRIISKLDRLICYAYRPLTWATAAGLLVAVFIASQFQKADVPLPSPIPENDLAATPDSPSFAAHLRGTVGARWAGERLELPEGEGFAAKQRLELVEGLAEVVFDSGARIVLQGPAIVEIRDDRTAVVSVGRTSTVVPDAAGQFRLRTAVADLAGSGAEFGAEVDVDGSLVTQVYEGDVELKFGGDATLGSSLQLAGGQGAQVDAKSGKAALLAEPSNVHFVRYLPNRETLINLAEVVAGGESANKAYHRGISLLDGRAVDDYGAPAPGTGRFIPAQHIDFVDGVFIPNGKRGTVQVDSIGRSFSGFPPTSDECWGGVIMARRPQKEDSLPLIRLEFHGNNYGYVNWLHIASKPDELSPLGYGLIGMHSNCGITFDLHAIRARYPDKKVMRFRSLVGNLESRNETSTDTHTAEAWVLVDGQLRHHRKGFNRDDGSESIDVSLADRDRFLVLAVTDDGGDTAYDWVAFGDAVIEMSNLEVISLDGDVRRERHESTKIDESIDVAPRRDVSKAEGPALSASHLATIALIQH